VIVHFGIDGRCSVRSSPRPMRRLWLQNEIITNFDRWAFCSDPLAAKRLENPIELLGRSGRNVLVFRKAGRKSHQPPVPAVAMETEVVTTAL
jgi:hypothetical protein